MVVPLCRENQTTTQTNPDYPELVGVQWKFADVIESTLVDDTSLAFSVQRSQIAVRDLAAHVHVSDLVSKDLMVEHLDSFVADAMKASDGLLILNARVGGAIDR